MSFNINHIARLAHLELKEEERKKLTDSMDNILHFVETIARIDVENQEPIIRSISAPLSMRQDIPQDGLTPEEIKRNAPEFDDNYIIVPQIIKK